MHTYHYTASTTMRLLTILLLSVCSFAAYAAKPVPAGLEPLPPPPSDIRPVADAVDEPQVVITPQPVQKVEEFRAGGKLYMIKITPEHGVPYYLVDDQGDGKFVRQDSLDSGMRPPRWIIKRF